MHAIEAAASMRVVDSFTSVIRDAPGMAHRPQAHRAGFLARPPLEFVTTRCREQCVLRDAFVS
jgi:hypothetical protein